MTGVDPASPGRQARGRAALDELAALLAVSGELLAAQVAPASREELAPLGDLAAAGPRAAADPSGYAFVLEAVREGYLLHYRRARLLGRVEPDLALLAGDYLYALGLERLAAIGDGAAVAELADLISISAMLEAEEAAPRAIDWFWVASALAVGCGGDRGHDAAKAAIRSGSAPGELAEGSALALGRRTGLSSPLAEVAEAIHF